MTEDTTKRLDDLTNEVRMLAEAIRMVGADARKALIGLQAIANENEQAPKC